MKDNNPPTNGAFGSVKKGGKTYNFEKTTIDGVQPHDVGDVFWYRDYETKNSIVHKCVIVKIIGKIALLHVLDTNDEPRGAQYVDLRRVKVIQHAAPLNLKAPEDDNNGEEREKDKLTLVELKKQLAIAKTGFDLADSPEEANAFKARMIEIEAKIADLATKPAEGTEEKPADPTA